MTEAPDKVYLILASVHPADWVEEFEGFFFRKKKIIKKTQKTRTIYSFMLCSRVRSKIINFSVLNWTRKLEFSNLGCLNFADGAVKIIWTNLIRKQ